MEDPLKLTYNNGEDFGPEKAMGVLDMLQSVGRLFPTTAAKQVAFGGLTGKDPTQALNVTDPDSYIDGDEAMVATFPSIADKPNLRGVMGTIAELGEPNPAKLAGKLFAGSALFGGVIRQGRSAVQDAIKTFKGQQFRGGRQLITKEGDFVKDPEGFKKAAGIRGDLIEGGFIESEEVGDTLKLTGFNDESGLRQLRKQVDFRKDLDDFDVTLQKKVGGDKIVGTRFEVRKQLGRRRKVMGERAAREKMTKGLEVTDPEDAMIIVPGGKMYSLPGGTDSNYHQGVTDAREKAQGVFEELSRTRPDREGSLTRAFQRGEIRHRMDEYSGVRMRTYEFIDSPESYDEVIQHLESVKGTTQDVSIDVIHYQDGSVQTPYNLGSRGKPDDVILYMKERARALRNGDATPGNAGEPSSFDQLADILGEIGDSPAPRTRASDLDDMLRQADEVSPLMFEEDKRRKFVDEMTSAEVDEELLRMVKADPDIIVDDIKSDILRDRAREIQAQSPESKRGLISGKLKGKKTGPRVSESEIAPESARGRFRAGMVVLDGKLLTIEESVELLQKEQSEWGAVFQPSPKKK